MKSKAKIFLIGLIVGCIVASSVGVYASMKGSMIEVFYSINDILINGKSSISEDNRPFIYNGSTYVPLRFISEKFGYEVKWDNQTSNVIINTDSDIQDNTDKITKAMYNKIEDSMSLKQVEEILGEGEKFTSKEMGGINITTYMWVNEDGSNIQIMFYNDQINAKSQYRLK